MKNYFFRDKFDAPLYSLDSRSKIPIISERFKIEIDKKKYVLSLSEVLMLKIKMKSLLLPSPSLEESCRIIPGPELEPLKVYLNINFYAKIYIVTDVFLYFFFAVIVNIDRLW